jgi:hypothetical protein
MLKCAFAVCQFYTDKHWKMTLHISKQHSLKSNKYCSFNCSFRTVHYSQMAHHLFTIHNSQKCLSCENTGRSTFAYTTYKGLAKHLRKCISYHGFDEQEMQESALSAIDAPIQARYTPSIPKPKIEKLKKIGPLLFIFIYRWWVMPSCLLPLFTTSVPQSYISDPGMPNSFKRFSSHQMMNPILGYFYLQSLLSCITA